MLIGWLNKEKLNCPKSIRILTSLFRDQQDQEDYPYQSPPRAHISRDLLVLGKKEKTDEDIR